MGNFLWPLTLGYELNIKKAKKNYDLFFLHACHLVRRQDNACKAIIIKAEGGPWGTFIRKINQSAMGGQR